MKKRILFVIESLNIGGAEKSLSTLLNLLDYDLFDVDLQLFSFGGAFEDFIPQEVNILPLLPYFEKKRSILHEMREIRSFRALKFFCARIMYSILLRFGEKDPTYEAIKLWKVANRCFDYYQKNYDIAIAYAQGLPTFYVAEKIRAKKKLAWINVTYEPQGKFLDYIKPMYDKYDYVNAVSESVREQMQRIFHIPDKKVMVMKDILDVGFAHKMAVLPSNVKNEMNKGDIKILTVGRLSGMKGYDLAIEAAEILVNRKIDFTWYAIGEGPLRNELEDKIREKGLQDRFILLGSRTNPYPYFNECDLYVQTSKFEGFGITLAEAKMFGKPIVTTNFDAVYVQFENEKNGLIVDISAQAIADGIIRMLTDRKLREQCIENVKREKISNSEEIEKLYKVIEQS